METAEPNICHNCNSVNELSAKYCPNCGQKHTDGKITFAELWSEFKEAAFNIDSKTWRTFTNLFIPGKLTLEYFSGKHKKYVHPLRLLIVTSLLVIIAMGFQDFQSATNHRYDVKERIVKNYERKGLLRALISITDDVKRIYPEPQTQVITDTILRSFKDTMISLLPEFGDKYHDSIDLNHYISFGDEGPQLILKKDFLTKDEEELAEIYKKDAGTFDRLLFKQKVKHINDESQLTAAIVRNTSWAALLLMPCLALVLYFLNFRHQYYYIEHLIFTFHVHAFSFLLVTIMILGMNVFPWWIFTLLLLAILLYVFLSLWRVYEQSFFKTLLKFFIISISYGFLFFGFFIGAIIFNFLML